MTQDFSVLMACYKNDNPQHLKIAIDSVFDSSILPNELIIVVDGPVPNQIEIILENCCDNFQQIELIRLPKNVGLGVALNFGLNKCSHNLIARMDADDINCYNRFKNLLYEFENDSDLVICGTFIEEFIEDSNIKLIRKVPLSKKNIISRGKFRNPFNHVTVMFDKLKIIEVGSYENVPFFEDYYLWLKLITKDFKMKNIDCIGVNVRAGSDMVKRRSGSNFIKNEFNFLIKSYQLGFLNLPLFILNLLIRIPIRVLGPLNTITYKYILR